MAIDETIDIFNTSQLAIFVCGITGDFETQEDLLSLIAIHDNTRVEDIFVKVLTTLQDYDKNWGM